MGVFCIYLQEDLKKINHYTNEVIRGLLSSYTPFILVIIISLVITITILIICVMLVCQEMSTLDQEINAQNILIFSQNGRIELLEEELNDYREHAENQEYLIYF